jgi:hypothetical protein
MFRFPSGAGGQRPGVSPGGILGPSGPDNQALLTGRAGSPYPHGCRRARLLLGANPTRPVAACRAAHTHCGSCVREAYSLPSLRGGFYVSRGRAVAKSAAVSLRRGHQTGKSPATGPSWWNSPNSAHQAGVLKRDEAMLMAETFSQMPEFLAKGEQPSQPGASAPARPMVRSRQSASIGPGLKNPVKNLPRKPTRLDSKPPQGATDTRRSVNHFTREF